MRRRFAPIADQLLLLYPHGDEVAARESARALTRDATVVSMALFAIRRRGATSAPTYVYYFEHPVPVAAGTSFGTFHTGEVPYVFGTLDPARRPYDATDRAISEQLQEHWLAFMRSGNPNHGGLPQWKPYDAKDHPTMIFDKQCRLVNDPASEERIAISACPAYRADGSRAIQ